MNAFDTLRGYFRDKRIEFTDEEFALIQQLFVPTALPAGGFLQRAGDIATRAAFVVSGCLRVYVIDAKGKEHIVQFAPENWFWSDATSLMLQAPSTYYCDAVEATTLLTIDGPSHQRLVDEVQTFGNAFRAGLQRHSAAKDARIVSALSASAEERYTEFVRKYPSIVQRVPQWMLASYLGVTPETVSRIRRNLSRA